jgi:hypothetical protein
MGGTAVAYTLIKANGTVVASGTLKKIGALDYEFSRQNKDKVRYIDVGD